MVSRVEETTAEVALFWTNDFKSAFSQRWECLKEVDKTHATPIILRSRKPPIAPPAGTIHYSEARQRHSLKTECGRGVCHQSAVGRAKPKGSNCSLFKSVVTTFQLCGAVIWFCVRDSLGFPRSCEPHRSVIQMRSRGLHRGSDSGPVWSPLLPISGHMPVNTNPEQLHRDQNAMLQHPAIIVILC